MRGVEQGKGASPFSPSPDDPLSKLTVILLSFLFGRPRTQGGKNRRRGKNENENDKRELVFKEEGQGSSLFLTAISTVSLNPRGGSHRSTTTAVEVQRANY